MRSVVQPWKALVLFPAGCAPELLLRDAAGSNGLKALREAALADFHSAEQVWRWHATVSEYASSYWPLSEEKRRSLTIDLLPAWAKWLGRLPAEGGTTLSQLETNLPNLEASLDACIKAPQEIADAFLKALDLRLPSPDRTLALRELNAEVCRIQLYLLPPDENARRAGLLNNLGKALSYLGHREEALGAAKEASDAYRQLAKKNPDTFLPDLAMSLNNLGVMLSDLGRREEALETAKDQ
jgi:tetratricopeptide (TPR) repeat protein